jgi:hypothetical protein
LRTLNFQSKPLVSLFLPLDHSFLVLYLLKTFKEYQEIFGTLNKKFILCVDEFEPKALTVT